MIRSSTLTCTLTVALLTLTLWPAGTALAQLVNRSRSGLAIDGYDPVAYFTEGHAVAGNPSIEFTWNGTRYRFSTTANRERFESDPAAYVPQFGGFCAYAVSRGYTASIDPEAWAVVDSRLYLNYSKRVQRLWQEDVPGNIRKGDENWPKLQSSAGSR